MEFKAGTVFWMKPPRTAKPHVFFVLTDPTPEGTVLIANMTTLRGTVEDRSCIPGPADAPAVQCPSAMRYDQAANAPVAKLAEAESRGLLTPHRDASPELLARIIAGAQASPDLNPSLRALLPDRAAALPPRLDARTDAPALPRRPTPQSWRCAAAGSRRGGPGHGEPGQEDAPGGQVQVSGMWGGT